MGITDGVHHLLETTGLLNLQSRARPMSVASIIEFFNTVKIDNKPSGDCVMRYKTGGVQR